MRKIQLAFILLLTAALAFTMTACSLGGDDGDAASSPTDLAALHALHFSADNAAGGAVTARTAQVVLVDGQEIAEGTTVYLAALPADGYDFDGWYEGDAKVGSELIYTFTITKDRTLVAKFTQKQQFTLTYSAENSAWGSVSGDVPSGTRVISGTGVTLTATPASGYDFDGWYEGGVKIGNEPRCTVTVNADRTLVAKFTPQSTVVTHTVTFIANGQTHATQQVTSGQCATAPTAPQVSGQRFVGWYNGNTAYNFSAPVTGNLTLTAKFEPIQPTVYTVTFIASGQTHATQQVTSGQCATAPTEPQVSGQRFVGWYNGNTAYNFSAPVTSNLTLTAKFEPIQPTVYTVTFIANGQTHATQQVTSGQCATAPTEPQVSGQRFVGWYNGNTAYNFSAPVTSNLTLTAHFESTGTSTDPDLLNNFTLTRQNGVYVLAVTGEVNVGGFRGEILVQGTAEDLTALDEDYVTVYQDGSEIRFIWSHGFNVQDGFEILSFAADEGAVLVLQEVYAFDSNANPAPIDYHVDGV